MLLSTDLIRDTLKCVNDVCEAHTNSRGKFEQTSHHWKSIYENTNMSNKYDIDEIKYCLVQLYEAGFIYGSIPSSSGGISFMHISGLTWNGHELLKNMSNDTVWAKVKKKLGDATELSIQAVAPIATEAAIAYAKSKMGLS